jgi:formylglycine-generating enzyme required for sulfatase activity
VDSTEVNNAQYAQFVASGYSPGPADVPAGCDPTTSPMPSDEWPPPPGGDALPVISISWCQAWSYCHWAGKRLCGQIGAGPLLEQYRTDATQSQWFAACSKGGTQAYPYGQMYDPSICGGQNVTTSVALTGSRPACQGGYPGLYDMSGNVWEWTDTCASTSPTDFCDTRGGAFDSRYDELQCSGLRIWKRNSSAHNLGFRCCAELAN